MMGKGYLLFLVIFLFKDVAAEVDADMLKDILETVKQIAQTQNILLEQLLKERGEEAPAKKDVEEGSDYSADSSEASPEFEKVETKDGFKLVLKNPKDGMHINVPKLIKEHGSKYLKNPDKPLNLKIDKVSNEDGSGSAAPKRVKTKDGFKLVYPQDTNFNVDIGDAIASNGEEAPTEEGSDYSADSSEASSEFEKVETKDGFKLVLKNPEDGMKINVPKLIKEHGSKYLKNPDKPLNLKIDEVTKEDGSGPAAPMRVKTKDGFKLVYPQDTNFKVNLGDAIASNGEEAPTEEGSDYSADSSEASSEFEKVETKDGFKLVLKHPKDGMHINIPKMIKKYGSKYLKNPDKPLNLKLDKVSNEDGSGPAAPKRVKTKDGFTLVYPQDKNFNVDIGDAIASNGKAEGKAEDVEETGSDYSEGDDNEPVFVKKDTADGFELVLKNPKDGMNINIPKLIKTYGRKFLKNPDKPLNLKIDRVTKDDHGYERAKPKRVQTEDGFKLVYPQNKNFDVNIPEIVAGGGEKSEESDKKVAIGGGTLGDDNTEPIKDVQQTKDGFKVTLDLPNKKKDYKLNVHHLIKKYYKPE